MNIKKGDLVEVITGVEKGRQGKVLRVIRKKNKVVIDGLNFKKKHTRTRSAQQPGGIIDIPAPIHISNVRLICPKCARPTKIKMRKIEGKRRRVCKLCEEELD